MIEDNDTSTAAAGELIMCTYEVYNACISKSAKYPFQTLYFTMQVNPETMIPVKLDEFGVPIEGYMGTMWDVLSLLVHQ